MAVLGGLKMTRAVLPQMKARKKGAIVNIGSAAATVAPSGPLYAIYAGTKVFNLSALRRYVET
jgi:17beta-estradiol 17-dehydrogenase / very-long-chain 3-oxoacyl-CoA reductase